MRVPRQFTPYPQAEIPREPGHPGHLRSLAASARLANVPSVVSNVCTGAMIGLLKGAADSPIALHLALLIPAGTCLYLGGNFLNDWSDREWDTKNRPERALPRGLFKPRIYLTAAVTLSLLGMGLAAAANLKSLAVAVAIIVCVLIYTAVHKKKTWSVIPMGLCRALLPALGFFGCSENTVEPGLTLILASGFALFCYIAGLSLSARHDTHASWSSCGLLTLAGIIAACGAFGVSTGDTSPITAVTAFAVWMLLCHRRFRKTVSCHVSRLLAGIPLVDWIFILPAGMAMVQTRPIAAVHGLIWVPPLAFLTGLALQRLAPAT